MDKRLLTGLVAGLFLLLGGCGGNGDDVSGPSVPNIAGTWDATLTVTGGTQAPAGSQATATLTIDQTGNSISGTFVVDGGGSGDLSGTVSSSSVSFDVDQQNPCDGNFSGSGTLSNGVQQISGSYSGSDCSGTLQANIEATKR